MPISLEEKEKILTIFTGECVKNKVCPIKDIMASYGDKWSMYTVLVLGKKGTMRFNELSANINGISHRLLTVTLRSLQHDGIVQRTLFAEIPPKVEYCLTPLGESLLRQLLQLATWAEANFEQIMDARQLGHQTEVAH